MPIAEYGVWPKKIITGPGSIARLGSEVKALGGKRVILFSGPHISKTSMVLDPVDKMRAEGLEVRVFSDLNANPTENNVYAGVDAMKEFCPDVLVVIGGGSPLDCAKAANVVYTHGGKATDYNVNTGGIMNITKSVLPMIAVPTTAGTGSEVTPVGVITAASNHIKFGIVSPKLMPDVALLDPELTVGLSPKTTAFTGIDALTHLIEAYVSVVNSPVSNGISLQGIKMVREALPAAYKDGNDMHARDIMLQASCMGGLVITFNNLGLCHQMAHQLSSYFDTAHGLANAVLLPYVMEFNMRAVPEKYADIACALGVDTHGMSTEEAALAGIEEVRRLNRELGIPEYLDDIGIDKAKVPEMAVTALMDGVGSTNPVPTTVAECEAVFYKAFR